MYQVHHSLQTVCSESSPPPDIPLWMHHLPFMHYKAQIQWAEWLLTKPYKRNAPWLVLLAVTWPWPSTVKVKLAERKTDLWHDSCRFFCRSARSAQEVLKLKDNTSMGSDMAWPGYSHNGWGSTFSSTMSDDVWWGTKEKALVTSGRYETKRSEDMTLSVFEIQ